MKRKLRNLLDFFLIRVGIQTIRVYELNYLEEKFTTAVEELYQAFADLVSKIPKKDYQKIYLLKNLYGTSISEGLYIISYLHKSINLKGDICEFGVAMGATSTLLANEIKKYKKKLWLFDSFKGLSKPTEKDILIDDMFKLGSMKKYEGTMSYPEMNVLERLKKIGFPRNRTRIIKGYIEDTISQKKLPNKICFAYVDFDLYSPTIVALKFLHTRLSKGGYIIIDDYNFFSKGVQTAVKEFKHNYRNNYKLIFPHKFAGKFCIIQKVK